MPRYLVVHTQGQKRDDILIEGDDVTLEIRGSWAVLADSDGIALAIPSGQGASIQRVDEGPETAD
ncbi:hypothetical protein [Streptomyces sp. KL116D]|uniref:hypothetical protein n=1 Tax=Streptomyces sp. KL116D TaxID=3045152 RepID=UPI003556B2F5